MTLYGPVRRVKHAVILESDYSNKQNRLNVLSLFCLLE